MKQYLFLVIFIILTLQAKSQFGGSATYDFLNLTSSARINALGGNQVGLIDDEELSFSYYNPAALMSGMNNDISLNYIDYISDIKVGYAAYAHNFNRVGTFATGIQYINYGSIKEANEDGTLTGNNFSASDYAFNLIYSRNIIKKLNVGVNIKPIYSAYGTYSSFGIAADLGLAFVDSSGNFTMGIVAKNLGRQITTYYDGAEREPLPFDLQAGFSQRLEHAPFRFSATLQHLTEWDLTDKSTWEYDHKSETDFIVGHSDDVFKQFMRHVILGVEFIPSKNFIIGLGYNFQRRWELSVNSNPGAVGLSGGFTVKVSKFRVSYAIASYHLSSTSNIFSVSTNLSEFIR